MLPGASPSAPPFDDAAVTYGLSDTPDVLWFVTLIAILVAGFVLLALATWYTARRAKR